MSRTLLFKTKNTPQDGIEVQLVRVNPKALLPKSAKIPMLDGKDLEMRRLCPDCNHEFKPGQWMQEKYYVQGTDEDVTARKPEFQWEKAEEEGKRYPASMAATTTINIVQEIPFSLISKLLVVKEGTNFYFMKGWAGRKKDISSTPEKVFARQKALFDEALRMAKEGIAGLASYTEGKVFGKPTDPYYLVVYPVIVSNTQVLWVVRGAAAILKPEKEDFLYADAITTEPEEEIAAKPREELPPETLEIKNLL